MDAEQGRELYDDKDSLCFQIFLIAQNFHECSTPVGLKPTYSVLVLGAHFYFVEWVATSLYWPVFF